jgi:hypothetical protein
MAAAPKWKVYLAGEYRAACKYLEDAAMIVAGLGHGAQIRLDHGRPLWVEGEEDQPAGESYDHVRDVVMRRM